MCWQDRDGGRGLGSIAVIVEEKKGGQLMVCFCGDMVCTYVDFIPCFSFFLFSLQCSFSVYRGAAAALLLVLLQTLWEYTAESMWVIELQKSRAAAAAQQ